MQSFIKIEWELRPQERSPSQTDKQTDKPVGDQTPRLSQMSLPWQQRSAPLVVSAGRPKHIWSIWHKDETTHWRFFRKIAQICPNFVAMATGVAPTTFSMVPLNRTSPKTPYQAQTSMVYLPYKPSYSRFFGQILGSQFWGFGGLNQKSKNNVLQRESRRTNYQKMARFHRKTKKKKQFEIFAEIAQISLPWQQIKIRRTRFCSFCHGEQMAKKWLDSIEKQRRTIDLKERYKQTDRFNDKKQQTPMLGAESTDKPVGDQTPRLSQMSLPWQQRSASLFVSAGRPKHIWSIWHTRRLMDDFVEKQPKFAQMLLPQQQGLASQHCTWFH